jgi:ABC-type sugar transport system substrate-binding protein
MGGQVMETAEQMEIIRKIIAQGMAARIPAHITADKISDAVATFPRGSVWVVTIDLAAPIIAVGSTKATALLSAGIRAAKWLNEHDYETGRGTLWEPATVAEQFCVNVTELEIDGPGYVENCYE